MARGTTLGELVTMLRVEAKMSAQSAVGKETETRLKTMLRRQQELLYYEYDWPFLRVRQDITLAAGQRYYDFPTSPTVNIERVEQVRVKWNDIWIPSRGGESIERGIGAEHYNIHDSDDDERNDPVQLWDVIDTGSGEQIEVWPIPATDGGTFRIVGIRNLNALVSEADTADLDDQMIVLFCAAELLGEKGGGAVKEARAMQIKNRLTSRLAPNSTTVIGGDQRPPYRGRPREIHISSRASS